MQHNKQHKRLGARGEDIAVSFLREKGYRILEKNFRVKIGEIDIIAKDADTYCFIEVKTRRTQSRGSALEAVSNFKQRRLSQIALWYLKKKNLCGARSRFDVVAI